MIASIWNDTRNDQPGSLMDIPPFLFRRKQVTQVLLIGTAGRESGGRYGGGQPISAPRLASTCGRIR